MLIIIDYGTGNNSTYRFLLLFGCESCDIIIKDINFTFCQ